MCSGVMLAPIATIASLVSGGSRGVQSYSPPEQDLFISNPEPATPEPQLGIDNSDASGKAAKQGKQALRIDLKRNPSVAVPGAASSGVAVPRG